MRIHYSNNGTWRSTVDFSVYLFMYEITFSYNMKLFSQSFLEPLKYVLFLLKIFIVLFKVT